MMSSRFHTARLGFAILFLMLATPSAWAANYTWTTSGSGSVLVDGSGTWNTSALNWTTTGAGAAVAWPNLTTDIAVFGVNSGAAGTVTVASVSANGITFNQAGSGSYVLSGGTIAFGGTSPTITTASGVSAAIVSSATSASGLVTRGGGILTMSGSLGLASSGTFAVGQGEVVLASGAVVSNGQAFAVGTNVVGGTATLRIQSGASLSVNGSFAGSTIGTSSAPQANVVQEGGSVTISGGFGSMILGTNGGATPYIGSSSYTMQGGSLTLNNTTSGFLTVGRNAPAFFTQSGGTVALGRTNNDAITIGDYSSGTYELSGGSLTAAGAGAHALLGNRGGTGVLTLTNSGSFGVAGSMFLAVNANNLSSDKGSATINLQGGDLAVNGMTLGRVGVTGSNGPGTATFNFSGGRLRPYSANTSIGSATAANNFSISLSGTGATLSGIDRATAASRTLDVYANLQGAGDITISGGLVNLRGTNTNSGLTLVASGGTAALLGTATGLSSGGGGTILISNSVTLASSGTFAVGHGEVVLASGAVVSNGRAFSVGTNVIGGTATLRIQNDGSLAVNTDTGGSTIGTNSQPQAAVVQEGGSVTISGAAGSLVLSADSSATTYSGSASYTMQGGSLTLDGTANSFLSVGRNAPATFTQSGGTVTLASMGDALIIGDYSSGSFAISGGSLAAASTSANAALGYQGGSGTLTITNSGSVAVGGTMFLAANAADSATDKGSATINLEGGELALNGMTLGRVGTTGANGPGTATFNFSGGTLLPYSANTSIGSATAANNFAITLSGTGATLSGIDRATAASRTLDVYANLQGTGDITISGGLVNLRGTNTNSGRTLVASGGTAALLGTATSFSSGGGGTILISSSVTLASSGTFTAGQGEVVLASGAVVSNGQAFAVGTNVVGGTATLRIQSGASLSVNGSFAGSTIGTSSAPQANVVQEGGSVTISGGFGSMILGTNGGATPYIGSSSYTMQGGSLTLNNTTSGFLTVGRNAPAFFTQSGGTVALGRTNNDAITIGDYSSGTYELSGGSLTAAGAGAHALLGNRGGTGVLTLTNSGSFGVAGSMFLAVNANNLSSDKGSATINLQGGDLAVNGMTLGRVGVTGSNGPGTATFNFSGGRLRPYSANTSIGSATAANNFSISLSGTGATLSGIDRATAASRTLDVYANLQGAGDITISGGLVNLRGTNVFSGLASILSGGTAALLGTADGASGFEVNGTLDLSSQSSGFTFGAAQAVSGAGAIALPTTGPGVVLAGFLAPGNSPGTLAFTGAGILDITQAIDTESSRLLFELGSIGTSDLVTIASGTLAIGSGLLDFSDFNFTAIDGFSEGTYTLFSANAITGSLGSATTGAIGSYTGTLELSGNQIQLVVVPEPAAVTLAGLGVAAAAWTICRRRAGRAS